MGGPAKPDHLMIGLLRAERVKVKTAPLGRSDVSWVQLKSVCSRVHAIVAV